MATVTMPLEEWRAFEAALIEARAAVVDLTPEHPAWDAAPPPELDEHAVWRWRFDQVRLGPSVSPKPEPAPPPAPPKASNANDIAKAVAAASRR